MSVLTTLHVGDCAELLGEYEGQADLIVTSPPYDALREYGGHTFDFDRVMMPIVDSLKAGGVLVWVVADATLDGSESGSSFRQALAFLGAGLKLHDTMIFLKKGSGARTWERRHSSYFEFMFVFSKGWPKTVNLICDRPTRNVRSYRNRLIRQPDGTLKRHGKPWTTPPVVPRGNVWEYNVGPPHSHPDFPAAHEHPATFPFALAADHIRTWSEECDLVIDPMCGSGTTVRAAVSLGRRGVGMDIHPPYVELARRRMYQQVLI